MALENKASLPNTVITNVVYDDDGKFLLKELCGPRKQYLCQATKDGDNKRGVRLRREVSIGRENKYFKLFLLDNIFDGDGRFFATEVKISGP